MFRKSERQDGSVMIALILIIGLLSLIGGTLSRVYGTEISVSKNFYQGISAQYVAEAGLRHGLVVLIGNGDSHGLSGSMQISGQPAFYQVTCAAEGPHTRIRSIGVVGEARRSVSAEVARAGTLSLEEYALVSAGSMDIAGDLVVQGPLLATGPVGISGPSVSLSTPVEKDRATLPAFSLTAAIPLVTEQGVLRQELELGGRILTSQEPQLILDGATAHVRGPGIIWARGNVLIRGATLDEGVVVVSDGNITIEGHSRLVSCFIAAPQGWVEMAGDGIYVSGGMWARQHIDISGTGSLLSVDVTAVRTALSRLGVAESGRHPYVIHSWGL